MTQDKGRVTAYINKDLQEFMQAWAKEECRTLSGLTAHLIVQAVKAKQKEKATNNQVSP